jgi:hypothetical protein
MNTNPFVADDINNIDYIYVGSKALICSKENVRSFNKGAGFCNCWSPLNVIARCSPAGAREARSDDWRQSRQ